jgi:hypothetical protein
MLQVNENCPKALTISLVAFISKQTILGELSLEIPIEFRSQDSPLSNENIGLLSDQIS